MKTHEWKTNPQLNHDQCLENLHVRPIQKGEEDEWNRLMRTHHYLGFRTLVGSALKYVAVANGQWLALLGWGASAFQCAPRDRWIGWTREQQWKRLKYVVNNQRFLILPHIRVPNLASKTLALNVKRLSPDWEKVFGRPVLMAETFVDHQRFTGASYRAAGWQPLGQTQGYGRNGGRYFHHGQSKTILVRALHPRSPHLLAAPFCAPQGGQAPMVDMNIANIGNRHGLMEHLRKITDPRKRRGIRHKQAPTLAVAICAVLSFAKTYASIAEWAAELTQDQLRRLGCRYDLNKGFYQAPSEPTIRRTLQSIDAEEVDRAITRWLDREYESNAIAFDGKTLRGSRDADGNAVHLLSAFLHKEGVVLAQEHVDSKSNEITAVEPLLEPLDLEGKVITADAMHTQADHARYIKEEKHADYVFTVKGNQKTLREDISSLDDEDFFPLSYRKQQRARADRNKDDRYQ